MTLLTLRLKICLVFFLEKMHFYLVEKRRQSDYRHQKNKGL